MAYVSSLHKIEDVISLADLTGGVNYALPMDLIADNELSAGLNFFYDPNTFRLMNRPGISRYSSDGAGNPVNGGFYSSVLTKDLCSADGTLYYLDPSKAFTSIGSLSGSDRPTFVDFNSKVVVSSGGQLQTTNGTSISNIATAPVSHKVMTYAGRIVTAGDTTYPHRLFLSGPGDETDWDTSGGDSLYFDIAELVGDGIVDFNILGNDIVIFKGVQNKGIFRLIVPNGDFTQAYVKEDSQVNSSINFHTSIQKQNDLSFIDNNGFKSLTKTQKYGDIEQDDTGRKINTVITPTIDKNYAFVVENPQYSQIWIKYAETETVMVYHYLINAFIPVKFTGLYMFSGWYHEDDRFFLIGMDDGFVYKLDKNVYADNGADVPSYIYSKKYRTMTNMKTLGSLYRKLHKQTIVDYEGVFEGAATLSLEVNGGENTVVLATLPLTSGFDLLFEATDLLYVATDLLYGQTAYSIIANKLVNFYDARFVLALTSGAIKLNRSESRIAVSGRR